MDTIDCIMSRRSIRKFTEQPLEFDKIAKILEAGLHAPTAGNLQNFRFVLVIDKGVLRQLYDHCMRQEVINQSQAAIVICGEPDKAERLYGLRGKRLYTVQNCAAAAENMLLAAHALGLGACWVGAFDEDKVKTLLTIETFHHARPQIIIALGYPAEEPKSERKFLTSFVHFNSYENKVKDPHIVLRDYSIKWQKGIETAEEAGGRLTRKLKKALKKWQEKRREKQGIKSVMEKKKDKK
ncbi:MAG: nitroreductase family protein [Nanoarchaeota archaeon]|nr:nitroreductase family protein [DPANN group archaeon]MBL7116279.1 nitroreductase family protein [Nanoarchaeota archaeon]